MKLGELFFDLGIKSGGGAATLRDFMGKMGGLRLATLSANVALGAVGALMVKSLSDTANAAVAFQTFTNVTSLSWRELQKWQLVGERANVPVEAMTAAVTKLQSKLIDLQLRGEGAGLFNLLGVEPGRATETFHVLEKLMGAYKRMPGGVFANVAAGLGLDPVLTNLFSKDPGWVQQQMGEVDSLGMTSSQQGKALSFMKEYRDLWQEIRALSFEIGGGLAPTAQKWVEDLATIVRFMRENLADTNKSGRKFGMDGMREDMLNLRNWLNGPDKERAAREAAAGRSGPARGVVVEVKITGDASDATFARKVADEVAAQVGNAEAQITYPEAEDPNAEFTIPGRPR